MATLQELIESEIADFFAGFGSPGEPETPEDMQSQLLARITPLFSSMEQEPVFFIEVEGDDWIQTGRIPGSTFDFNNLPDGINKLYAAPQLPQPVVVDADDNFYSWFGREWHENYQHNQYTTAAKQMLGVIAESAWRAGRSAAMLQGAEPEFRENAETSTNCPHCGRKPLKNRKCSVAGCEGRHVAHGLCQKHYDIEHKNNLSRRKNIRAANKRYRARRSAAPQQEAE